MKIPVAICKWILPKLLWWGQNTPYFRLDSLNGEPYMDRWWLWRFGPRNDHGAAAWFAGRLHKIMRSDQDRDLHCHPWPYITLLLSGGYYEVLWRNGKEVTTWHPAGSILFRKADDRHRLILEKDTDGKELPTHSLFITFKKQKSWGFYTEDGFINWQEYDAYKERKMKRAI